MRFQRILAASALRDPPDPAVINAGTLARITGAELHVFHAGDPSLRSDEDAANTVRQRLARRAPAAASIAVAAGKAYRAISDHAVAIGADVVVLGPRVRRALPGLLGNTADRVVRTARVPSLLSNGDLSSNPSRILVALDRSPHARRALRVAERFATALRRHDGGTAPLTIHLFTVSAFGVPGRNLQRDFIDLAPIASRLVSRTRDLNVEVTHSTRSALLPADGIVDFSERFQPDLVVMGTHGDGPFVRALAGSVTLDVARVRSPRRPRWILQSLHPYCCGHAVGQMRLAVIGVRLARL